MLSEKADAINQFSDFIGVIQNDIFAPTLELPRRVDLYGSLVGFYYSRTSQKGHPIS